MTAALMEIADALDLSIVWTNLRGRDGEYRHDLRRIRIQQGLTLRMERSILAHELAHAVFADTPSKFGPVNAKQERRADEWAALQLITPHAYRAAEQNWNGHVPAMAYDLCVISRLVEAYQRVLQRIGNFTYVDARMGAGQWEHRFEVST